ncbi:MAG: hypothetical protein AAGB32_01685 [Pseudomonadota bacterium]
MSGSEEYLIYGYTQYHPYNFGRNRWQFLSKNDDEQQSQKVAQEYYYSRNFDRVEIKKKYFDEEKNRYELKTVEIIDLRKKSNLYFVTVGILIFLTFLGALILNGLISF